MDPAEPNASHFSLSRDLGVGAAPSQEITSFNNGLRACVQEHDEPITKHLLAP